MTHIVKYRSVSITVYPWQHPSGKEYWQYKHEGKKVTRATLADAKTAARNTAQTIYRGTLDLDTLTPEQIRACQRMIEADPSCRLVDEFLVWHGKKAPRHNAGEAIDEFLAAKEANRGRSIQNVRSLRAALGLLPRDVDLCAITPAVFPVLRGAPRTRKNVQSAWVTFFRWCVMREYLPHGEKTAPERLERPIIPSAIPATYTPAQLAILMANVSPNYLPWLALAAFAGVRTDESCPMVGGDKSPLMWEDFQWDRGIVIVRPETSKTNRRRVVPIMPALRAWLLPVSGTGPVGPLRPPSSNPRVGTVSETTRLGRLIGGWKRNALRHSFISFRAAQVGLSQTAMEAGNSESEARRSYNDAKGADEAAKWFAVMP